MIKYFHELTEDEYNELVKKKITYGELARDYPQPKWCVYPGATNGVMGCWALVGFEVTDEDYCKDCEYYIRRKHIEDKSLSIR